MEHLENEARRRIEDGGRKDPGRPGEDGRSPKVAAGGDPEARRPSERRDPSSWVNWQSALYVFVLGAGCLVLVPLTSFWWIVPVLGAAVPLALAALQRPDDRKARERELLEALAERGELTPTTAAMRTSLTVGEASKMLDELAEKGHLKLQAEDGILAYALPERDRPPEQGGPFSLSEPGPEGVVAPKPLDDPLSERELEVLALLASGRTNAEIAKDLFVAAGTVKSHINNIYRKLDARNRAEAVTRARDLSLVS